MEGVKNLINTYTFLIDQGGRFDIESWPKKGNFTAYKFVRIGPELT